MKWLSVSLAITLLGASLAVAAPVVSSKSAAAIPLKDCNPGEVLGLELWKSIEREGDNATQRTKVAQDMLDLEKSLPAGNAKASLNQLMTPAQNTRFTEMSSQIFIQNFNHIVESGLQRDNKLIALAATAIDRLTANISTLKSKDDPGADGAALVFLLRSAVKQDGDSIAEPLQQNVCSVDLALFMKEAATMSRINKIMESPEARDFLALRKTYKVNGALDPSVLLSPDREKAVWLLKAVGEPTSRLIVARTDWENLRRFAKVSMLEYVGRRNDIISGAGSKEFDYDSSIKKDFAAADSATKHTIDAWGVIEKHYPSEAEQEFTEAGKIESGGAKPKR